MPFQNVSGYLESLDEFGAHWALVNAAVETPLVLDMGYARAVFLSDQNILARQMTQVVQADNALQIAITARDQSKNALRERMRQFRATVIGLLPNTTFRKALPILPPFGAAPGTWTKTLDDIAGLWATINAVPPDGFTGPLLLAGGYTAAQFTADFTALKAAFTAVTNAERGARLAREERDLTAAGIRARLRDYRAAVAGQFEANSPLINTLPALSAPAGSTPDPVALSGAWNAAQTAAVLTWTASDNENLSGYSVRYHPGPTYKAAEEQAISGGTVGPTVTTLQTPVGLAAPGSVAHFKVYVLTSTGNEKGSNSVKVTRV